MQRFLQSPVRCAGEPYSAGDQVILDTGGAGRMPHAQSECLTCCVEVYIRSTMHRYFEDHCHLTAWFKTGFAGARRSGHVVVLAAFARKALRWRLPRQDQKSGR
jgi:hypothetical protein